MVDVDRGIGWIEQKWGFGMARIKPAQQRQRIQSAQTVRSILDGDHRSELERLDDISVVKGLYTRTYKKDQWDWFTVWSQLGFPEHKAVLRVSQAFARLRRSMKDSDEHATNRAIAELTACGVPGTLERFILGTPERKPDHGFIYILSTRRDRDILKIGYTERDVEIRAKEINSATGVIAPLGARAVWIVPHARRIESEIHRRLAEFRIRKDREFFEIKFSDATKIIDAYLASLAL